MVEHSFSKEDINVSDKFILKFSEMYIKQRSETHFDYKKLESSVLFQKHNFKSEVLKTIITKHSVAEDIKREIGEKPAIINDIYRSDLGELLLTYYFEEKLPEMERFKIPYKNISNRELAGLPGRGLDAIGYRVKDDKVELLIGEAKVSQQNKNPPDVVDYNKDSIYETQKKFRDNKKILIKRLSDYCRKLNCNDAEKIGIVLFLLEQERTSEYNIVFGCSLVRDKTCLKLNDDYGKLFTQRTDFEPHRVSFSIMNFDKQIDTTIALFYKKVQEICAGH